MHLLDEVVAIGLRQRALELARSPANDFRADVDVRVRVEHDGARPLTGEISGRQEAGRRHMAAAKRHRGKPGERRPEAPPHALALAVTLLAGCHVSPSHWEGSHLGRGVAWKVGRGGAILPPFARHQSTHVASERTEKLEKESKPIMPDQISHTICFASKTGPSMHVRL